MSLTRLAVFHPVIILTITIALVLGGVWVTAAGMEMGSGGQE